MSHPTALDITNMPDLVKIAEEVEATKTPRELKRENKTVAVIFLEENTGVWVDTTLLTVLNRFFDLQIRCSRRRDTNFSFSSLREKPVIFRKME